MQKSVFQQARAPEKKGVHVRGNPPPDNPQDNPQGIKDAVKWQSKTFI